MTVQRTRTRPAWRLALCLLAAAPSALSAQVLSDRLEFHGSLNAGYGRSHELPNLGLPVTGTSDYRVFTLQGRYTITEDDQIVAQVFNRRLGTSPLAAAVPDVSMQWAYYQHKAGDFTFKVGRDPLPRGLSNETRYIGTVHPFFRPSVEVHQDAFDAIDGLVVSYRHELGHGVEITQHGFAGGTESRVLVSTSTGPQVRVARAENFFGGQTFVTFPFAGLRAGFYGARYNNNLATSQGYRTNVVSSVEATIDRLKLETERSRTTGHGPVADSRTGYYQATVRLVDRLSIAGQHAHNDRMLFFANTDLQQMIPDVRTDGVSGIFRLTDNAVFKLEHHWRKGWGAFDNAPPAVASQTATSVTLTEPSSGRYFLVSVAASF